jgi:hypothetical protein
MPSVIRWESDAIVPCPTLCGTLPHGVWSRSKWTVSGVSGIFRNFDGLQGGVCGENIICGSRQIALVPGDLTPSGLECPAGAVAQLSRFKSVRQFHHSRAGSLWGASEAS